MIKQTEITIKTPTRGFFVITDEILNNVNISNIKMGMMNIFLKHTSASLSINENISTDVRIDLENFSSNLIDNKNYIHSYEGEDDMPAHIKSSLFGVSLNIPITNGKLNIGTWQGIYLNEHRNTPQNRKLVITIFA